MNFNKNINKKFDFGTVRFEFGTKQYEFYESSRESLYTSILCLEVLFIDFTNLKFIFEKKYEVILVILNSTKLCANKNL